MNERIKEADRKCMERYCLQSTRDSRSNQTVSGKLSNDLWLRSTRTLFPFLFFLYNFKFLILSVVVVNMKTFCEHNLIKKL